MVEGAPNRGERAIEHAESFTIPVTASAVPHSATPAPSLPSPAPLAGTSTSSSSTLTASPHAAAGKLREVTRARPLIATNTRYRP